MAALYKRQFDTFDDAKAAINVEARHLGFGLVVHRSIPNASHPVRVILRCCKGRRYNPEHNPLAHKKRLNIGSWMTGCAYKLTIASSGIAVIMKRPREQQHNHSLHNVIILNQFRREAIQKHHSHIISLYNSGIKPVGIVEHLQH